MGNPTNSSNPQQRAAQQYAQTHPAFNVSQESRQENASQTSDAQFDIFEVSYSFRKYAEPWAQTNQSVYGYVFGVEIAFLPFVFRAQFTDALFSGIQNTFPANDTFWITPSTQRQCRHSPPS